MTCLHLLIWLMVFTKAMYNGEGIQLSSLMDLPKDPTIWSYRDLNLQSVALTTEPSPPMCILSITGIKLDRIQEHAYLLGVQYI